MKPGKMKTVSKIPFWATALTLLGVIILCTLGTWQVQRLHWKEKLLTQIDALYESPAATNPVTLQTLNEASLRGDDFLRGTIRGHYLPEKTFHTGPRILDDQQGAHLYTPFALQGGGTVLVNRGWVPNDNAASIPTPSGIINAPGLFRKPDRANTFTPPDDVQGNIFYQIDPEKIAVAKNLDQPAPYILYLERDDVGTLPRAISAKPELNNNHKSYALFWFTMAGVLVVIYILRFILPLSGWARITARR